MATKIGKWRIHAAKIDVLSFFVGDFLPLPNSLFAFFATYTDILPKTGSRRDKDLVTSKAFMIHS